MGICDRMMLSLGVGALLRSGCVDEAFGSEGFVLLSHGRHPALSAALSASDLGGT